MTDYELKVPGQLLSSLMSDKHALAEEAALKPFSMKLTSIEQPFNSAVQRDRCDW